MHHIALHWVFRGLCTGREKSFCGWEQKWYILILRSESNFILVSPFAPERSEGEKVTRGENLSRSRIEPSFLFWRIQSLIYRMLFYSSVCEIELCARSIKTDIFGTSAKKWFYPRVDVAPEQSEAKRRHEDKITFASVYRTLSFHATCG